MMKTIFTLFLFCCSFIVLSGLSQRDPRIFLHPPALEEIFLEQDSSADSLTPVPSKESPKGGSPQWPEFRGPSLEEYDETQKAYVTGEKR